MSFLPCTTAFYQSARIAEHVPTPCLSTAYINTPVPVEITGAFPIMSLLGKREEGGTL